MGDQPSGMRLSRRQVMSGAVVVGGAAAVDLLNPAILAATRPSGPEDFDAVVPTAWFDLALTLARDDTGLHPTGRVSGVRLRRVDALRVSGAWLPSGPIAGETAPRLASAQRSRACALADRRECSDGADPGASCFPRPARKTSQPSTPWSRHTCRPCGGDLVVPNVGRGRLSAVDRLPTRSSAGRVTMGVTTGSSATSRPHTSRRSVPACGSPLHQVSNRRCNRCGARIAASPSRTEGRAHRGTTRRTPSSPVRRSTPTRPRCSTPSTT